MIALLSIYSTLIFIDVIYNDCMFSYKIRVQMWLPAAIFGRNVEGLLYHFPAAQSFFVLIG